MIDLDIFGRGEIKRLNWELRHKDYQCQELENENQYLRGVKTAQSATIDRLMQEVRAQDELIRQLQATEKKLFQMYTASEAARQELAGKAGAREAMGAPHQSRPATASPEGEALDSDVRLGPLGQKGRPIV